MPDLDFNQPAPEKPKVVDTRTKSMSELDDLTHDFTDSESFRAMCLEKYGQYFKDGVRYTQ